MHAPVIWESNKLWNATGGMAHFFWALYNLETGLRDQVVVVHIGDSHIQADWFSGKVRTSLQQHFGNAGRGLVFPLRQARTNAAPDIRSTSNVSWHARRISSTRNYPPVGISGFGLRTYAPGFELALEVAPNETGLDYSFNRVTFFTDKGPGSYDLWIGENKPLPAVSSGEVAATHRIERGETLSLIARKYGCSVANLMDWNGMTNTVIYAGTSLVVEPASAPSVPIHRRNMPSGGIQLDLSSRGFHPYMSSLRLPESRNRITVTGMHDQATQQSLTLYGMVLEKDDQPGVLYHAIGANGARVDHYLDSEMFWEQLATLKPDLVIISLGTNETVSPAFQPDRFADKIDRMVDLAKRAAPGTSVLLTTPADALQQRRRPNPEMSRARGSLLELAMARGYAAWDFLGVMGGSGSIYTWQQNGLAQPDGIHLTQTGYELQGNLLHQALMEAYGQYRTYSSR